MGIKQKIVLLMLLPLLLAIVAVGAILLRQGESLGQKQEAALVDTLLAAKRLELEHHVSLALTALAPLYASGDNSEAVKAQARAILRGMNYGADGYFFVYDLAGTNEVHPRKPEVEGRNLWDMHDPGGVAVIQRLIEAARAGGGFVRYQWEKPSTGKVADKLGYAVMLERWGWTVGTGLYLDDLDEAVARIRGPLAAKLRTTMLDLAAVALVALMLVGAGGLAFTLSESRLADQRLKQLTQRIVILQEEERRRVARELHDGISQVLVSAKFQLELAEEHTRQSASGVPPGLALGIARIGDAVAEIRAISHDLRSAVLDDLGLAPAIEQLCSDFSCRTGIAVTARQDLPANCLDKGMELTLFRIAQEALTNVERHAAAREVLLLLDAGDGRVNLRVTDDGCGVMTGAVQTPGIGLRNLLERVQHLGGGLELAVAPGGGTRLIAWLPVAKT